MTLRLTEMSGIDFPLFAFSHCRDVVIAVSKAGGLGVFGALHYTPEQLREELAWIERHVDGRPWGVDLIVANGYEAAGHTGEITTLVLVPQVVEAVAPLPVPLQTMATTRALTRISRGLVAGHGGAQELATTPAGQGIGLIREVRGYRQIVQDYRESFAAALEDFGAA
jgi:NAD(P)H-dependent flavin oxidoreductase YrpB (nitropropane dioxygenase family)